MVLYIYNIIYRGRKMITKSKQIAINLSLQWVEINIIKPECEAKIQLEMQKMELQKQKLLLKNKTLIEENNNLREKIIEEIGKKKLLVKQNINLNKTIKKMSK